MLRALEPLGVHVLVVDDNSPDGTGEIADRLALERIDLDAIRARGYAFQIETTYRAIRAGFDVVEVPIVFADRTAGQSKMSRTIVLEAVTQVPALRFAALRGEL